MRRRKLKTLTAGATMICGLALTTAQAQLFHRAEPAPVEPPTLEQIARTLDKIEDSVRDDGIVVIKQPDVWGQARMTKYRREFEQIFLKTMLKDTANFDQGLQAIIARSDQASFESRSALAAVLTPTTRGSNGRRQEITVDASKVGDTLTPMTTNVFTANGLPGFEKGDQTKTTSFASPFATEGQLLGAAKTAFGFDKAAAIEPTVKLDELKRYVEYGQRLRQNQQGDDVSDSAGYGLYLIRMPVSIQAGEITHKGHGAIVTTTMYHDFGPDFLEATFRNLVINDLVDQLGPAVYELLRSNVPKRLKQAASEKAAQESLAAAEQARGAQLAESSRDEIIAALTAADDELIAAQATAKRKQAFALLQDQGIQPNASVDLIRKRFEIQSRSAISALDPVRGAQELPTPEASLGLNTGAAPGVNVPRAQAEQQLETDSLLNQLAEKRKILEGSLKRLNVSRDRDPNNCTPGADPYDVNDLIRLVNDWLKDDGPDRGTVVKDLCVYIEKEFPGLTTEQRLKLSQTEADKIIRSRDLIAIAHRAAAAATASVQAIEVEMQRLLSGAFPSTRSGIRSYPIAPTDVEEVFLRSNLLRLAEVAEQASLTKKPRATDIRTFLRHELSTAYDLFADHVSLASTESGNYVEVVAENVRNRRFLEGGTDLNSELGRNFLHLIQQLLPGDLKAGNPGPNATDTSRIRILQSLTWAVTVEAGLLNHQLRSDMLKLAGTGGFACEGAEAMAFYQPMPPPGASDPGHPYSVAQEKFNEYVRKRWPIITFALDPVTDQQNIADAYSRERDLQLAMAFAFSAGRINFQQMNRYIQRLRYEAATIDLNRTVTSFAYGNDTFGWRFSPRYQTPPEERNNLRRATNLIVKGGPGRDYQMRNSKLEAGQRELTAVVIMPSILQRIRMDVNSNWYPLHDPDEMEIPTARMVKQGREVVELRDCLSNPDICRHYRPGDVQRITTRVKQLEAMLPMQTLPVQVPYENTLGGFQLFSQGSTALVPELLGFEGIDEINPAVASDIFIYGKHFSIHETNIVAGGMKVSRSLDFDGIAKAVSDVGGDATKVSLPAIDAEILSRQVMRITIPQSVSPTLFKEDTADGRKYLEVYLATPNGLSNRLMIPVKSDTATSQPASQAVSSSGFALSTKNLALNYQWRALGAGSFAPEASAQNPAELKIDWSDPVGVGPQSIDVAIKVAFKDRPTVDLGTYSFTSTGGPYVQNTKDVVDRMLTKIREDVAFKPGELLPVTGEATLTVVPKGVGPNVYQTDPMRRLLTDKLAITLNPVSVATAPRQAVAPGLGAIPARTAPASSLSARTSAPPTAPVVRNPAPAMSRGEAYATSPTAGHVQAPRDPGVGRVGYPPQSLPQATRPASPYVAPTASRPAAPAPVDRRAVAPARAPIVPSTAPARPAPSPAPARQVPPPASKPQRRSILSRIGGRAD